MVNPQTESGPYNVACKSLFYPNPVWLSSLIRSHSTLRQFFTSYSPHQKWAVVLTWNSSKLSEHRPKFTCHSPFGLQVASSAVHNDCCSRSSHLGFVYIKSWTYLMLPALLPHRPRRGDASICPRGLAATTNPRYSFDSSGASCIGVITGDNRIWTNIQIKRDP